MPFDPVQPSGTFSDDYYAPFSTVGSQSSSSGGSGFNANTFDWGSAAAGFGTGLGNLFGGIGTLISGSNGHPVNQYPYGNVGPNGQYPGQQQPQAISTTTMVVALILIILIIVAIVIATKSK